MVMPESVAARQDIRPLRIALLNLMPKKIQTETQFARLIGATPLQIELYAHPDVLARGQEHRGRAHGDVLSPVQRRARREVRRPDHHRRPDRASAFRPGHLLGRAGADLRLDPEPCARHLRGLLGRNGNDQPLPRRRETSRSITRRSASSGTRTSPRPRPICADFQTIASCRSAAGRRCARTRSMPPTGLQTLLGSDEVGPCLVEDRAHRALYIFNHFEYDSTTLAEEHARDMTEGRPDRHPAQLLPRRRPVSPAAEPLAQSCASALWQLDQRDIPDHALRAGRDWPLACSSARDWSREPARRSTCGRAGARGRRCAAYPPAGEMVTLADGRRVHAIVEGRGPDVVLIHGAGGNARDFTLSFTAHLRDRFRVIAFDRPGFGHSDSLDARLAENPVSQALALSDAAARLGAHRPLVLGHSYGGAVALGWALERAAAGLVVLAGASLPVAGRRGTAL